MANEPEFRRILLYLNGSEESFLALRYALSLAELTGGELLGVYVVDEKTLAELTKAKVFVEKEEQEYEQDLINDGKKFLRFLEKQAAKRNIKVSTYLLRGIVHEEVVKKAQELGADLLVMGELEEALSRKDSFYDEEERIFREAPCPVLVVKE